MMSEKENMLLDFIQKAIKNTNPQCYVNGIKYPGLSKNYFRVFYEHHWDTIIDTLNRLTEINKIKIRHHVHENGEEDFCISLI